MICTPQFFENQAALKRKVAWRDGQFVGRVGHIAELPETLGDADLLAVARARLPEGNAECHRMLVAYAKASARYLAGIDAAVRRVRYEAVRDGISIGPAILARVISRGVMPSDAHLANSISRPLAAASQGRRRRAAVAPPPPFGGAAAGDDNFPEPMAAPREIAPARVTGTKRQTTVEIPALAGG